MGKSALVVTTIFEPLFLNGYLDNIAKYGHDVSIIIIPDRKTPVSVYAACDVASDNGFDIRCPTLDEQCDFLRSFGINDGWIPFDSDNRRNVGFLMALVDGCDRVVSIDDDNFCGVDDFFGQHNMRHGSGVVRDGVGWLNVCDELVFDRPGRVFPRGFPYSARDCCLNFVESVKCVDCMVNVGLWYGDPDVDSVSRLCLNPKVVGFSGNEFFLGDGCWSPINTQNTSVCRSAMAAYYYIKMGFNFKGLVIDRFGDILSGFFVEKCVKHFSGGIRVGGPVCVHDRSRRDLFVDLYHELAGLMLIEELLLWLVDVKLSGSSFIEVYDCLIDELECAAHRFKGFVFDRGGREFLVDMVGNMRVWSSVMKIIQI